MSKNKLPLLVAFGLCFASTPAAAAQSVSPPVGSVRTASGVSPQQNATIPATPSVIVPINALPVLITQPGYYQVTQDLIGPAGMNGITIAAGTPGVYIDLNGFTLSGSNGSLHGISGGNKLTVFNGRLREWDGIGIRSDFEALISNVIVTLSGDNGIQLAAHGRVEGCTSTFNGGDGIRGRDLEVVDCHVEGNMGDGIEGTGTRLTVRGSSALKNKAYGILAEEPAPAPDGPRWTAVKVDCCLVFENVVGGIKLGGAALVSDTVVRDHIGPGIVVGDSCQVVRCVATDNLGNIGAGHHGSIRECTVEGGAAGISAMDSSSVTDCEVRGAQGFGIAVGSGSSVRSCIANGNGTGIAVSSGRIERCTAHENTMVGIQVNQRTIVEGCTVENNLLRGVVALGTGNRIDGNLIANNGTGLEVLSSRCQIVRNTFDSNTIHTDIPAGNFVGPFVKTQGFIDSTSPWANFDVSFPVPFP